MDKIHLSITAGNVQLEITGYPSSNSVFIKRNGQLIKTKILTDAQMKTLAVLATDGLTEFLAFSFKDIFES